MSAKKYVAPTVVDHAQVRFETAVSGSVAPKTHVLVDPTKDDTYQNVNGVWTLTDPTGDDYWIWQ